MRKSVQSLAAVLMVLLLALTVRHTLAADKVYKVGDKIADFTYKNEQGKQVSLSDYKGKIVVLNFYASW